MVAHWLAVSEIGVHTLPRANKDEQILLSVIIAYIIYYKWCMVHGIPIHCINCNRQTNRQTNCFPSYMGVFG